MTQNPSPESASVLEAVLGQAERDPPGRAREGVEEFRDGLHGTVPRGHSGGKRGGNPAPLIPRL